MASMSMSTNLQLLTTSPLIRYNWRSTVLPSHSLSSNDYLGMPYTANGIDFTSFVATVTQRTQKLFFASTRNSRGWSPYIRLLLFKTLFRSTYEYALPLLFAQKLQLSLCRSSRTSCSNGFVRAIVVTT